MTLCKSRSCFSSRRARARARERGYIYSAFPGGIRKLNLDNLPRGIPSPSCSIRVYGIGTGRVWGTYDAMRQAELLLLPLLPSCCAWMSKVSALLGVRAHWTPAAFAFDTLILECLSVSSFPGITEWHYKNIALLEKFCERSKFHRRIFYIIN